MEGRARAPAAGTVLNALATETGAAFAIDEYTTATVELDRATEVTAEVAEDPDADTRLIEECVAAVTDRFGDGEGGHVRTESEVPMAAGLKSSSAAANATVLATLSALDATDELDRADACRLGVDVAREVGVTVTGAFDDASASMLGGVTVTDNATDELLAREERDWDVLVWAPPERAYSADADVGRCRQVAPMADLVADLALDATDAVSREEAARIGVQAARDVGITVTVAFDDASASMLGGVTVTDNDGDELLARETRDWDVLVWTPPERAYSADADVERCRRIAPVADLVADLALSGEFERAMTVNGFAFCGALGFSAEPLVEGLAGAAGVSLSGTGPSFTAVGDRDALAGVRDVWAERGGRAWLTTTQSEGTLIDD